MPCSFVDLSMTRIKRPLIQIHNTKLSRTQSSTVGKNKKKSANSGSVLHCLQFLKPWGFFYLSLLCLGKYVIQYIMI